MLFKPLADAGDCALVGVRRRVWPMEDSHFVEKDNSHTATFSLADLGSEFVEECFDILPLDVRTGRVGEDDFERALVLPLHAANGTT